MVKPDKRGLWYSGRMIKKNTLRNKMIDGATILFDDSKNDLRALPKTVRLQSLWPTTVRHMDRTSCWTHSNNICRLLHF
jgi:hypothetical protein